MPDPARPPNPFFPLAALSAGLFIITILAMLASLFGDPQAPLAQLFDRFAGRLIAGEVVATLAIGFLALLVDRLQTLRAQKTPEQDPHDQPHED